MLEKFLGARSSVGKRAAINNQILIFSRLSQGEIFCKSALAVSGRGLRRLAPNFLHRVARLAPVTT